MTSFTNICIVWFTVCVGLCADPDVTVSKPVGSTAVLPCTLSPLPSETPFIIWHNKNGFVFEREGEESYQGEGYEGRVDVPVEELRKGNCSLVLRDLRLNDAGVYTSYQIEGHTKRSASAMTKSNLINSVELEVTIPVKGTNEKSLSETLGSSGTPVSSHSQKTCR
ncbi:CD276 antigen homolog isoform X2 [Clarias gariepinus]|uniref:CD276 antigen homolog isoform X2 n=1 Tax=Clarias gariepinus TaxID=13013 RepID=UPI00234C4280|nr:CD276 antigen homolog isoform X2 [Clarias gariepinus]